MDPLLVPGLPPEGESPSVRLSTGLDGPVLPGSDLVGRVPAVVALLALLAAALAALAIALSARRARTAQRIASALIAAALVPAAVARVRARGPLRKRSRRPTTSSRATSPSACSGQWVGASAGLLVAAGALLVLAALSGGGILRACGQQRDDAVLDRPGAQDVGRVHDEGERVALAAAADDTAGHRADAVEVTGLGAHALGGGAGREPAHQGALPPWASEEISAAPQAGSPSASAIRRTSDDAARRLSRERPDPSARWSVGPRIPRVVSTAAVRPVPAAVVPRPAACAPIPFTSVSAMKLSLSRFIARRIAGSGGEVADPICRGRGRGHPHGEAADLRDAHALERRLDALGGRDRGAADVRGTRVAGVVLVGDERRQRRGVGPVVGGPARPHAAGVEEVLVGDDRPPDQPDPARAHRAHQGGDRGRADAQVASGVRACGENRDRPRPSGRPGPRGSCRRGPSGRRRGAGWRSGDPARTREGLPRSSPASSWRPVCAACRRGSRRPAGAAPPCRAATPAPRSPGSRPTRS